MTTARKVIDWHGQGGDELAREMAPLPVGRYVLVPEGEVAETLSADDEAALDEAFDDFDRGAHASWEGVRAEGRALLDAVRTGRGR